LTYLREICELLWPPPAMITIEGGGPGWHHSATTVLSADGAATDAERSQFFLIPSARRPRLLVPTAPTVAAAALRHYGKPASRATRLGAKILSLGLAGTLGGTLLGTKISVYSPPDADNIEAYLKTVISQDIRVSIHLGIPRANRKPVLQLLTPAGETVGFAKVGVNPLTRDLVRAERLSLARLDEASLAEIAVPRILHYGEWKGLDVLVLSALPVWLRHRPTAPARLAAAMEEVAHVGGVRAEPLRESTFPRELGDRLAGADEGPVRDALLESLDTLLTRAGDTVISFGAWHGDWTQWNMANTGKGLLVWDWERFTCGVPLGFDALHYWLQAEVDPGRRQPLAAASECPERAAQLLAPFGVPAKDAWLTAVLYLIDLATRYLVDGQAKAGAPRGAPETWLIPAIIRKLERL
jgi:hypothetical protein